MEALFGEDGELAGPAGPTKGAVDADLEDIVEAARDLKLQGNSCFGSKKWLEAAKLYASAIRSLQVNSKPSEVICKLSCGQRVSVKDDAREREGIIACDNDDDTFDVMFDDGTEADAVKSCRMRPIRILSDHEMEARELEAACYLNSARCAYQVEVYPLAVSLASKSIQKDGSNAAGFFVRGRARLAVPTLDDARSDLKQAVIMQPSNVEYRRAYEDCKQRIKTRDEENRKTAAMMLSYMRSEGITGS
jgi:tetratricopeptide (TPR) repeat protein